MLMVTLAVLVAAGIIDEPVAKQVDARLKNDIPPKGFDDVVAVVRQAFRDAAENPGGTD